MKGSGIKKFIIPIAVAAVALVGIIAAVIIIFSNKKEEYRIVKVYESEGDVIVNRTSTGEINAYDNMVLETGDNVKVGEGFLTLKLDDDKYIYAEENTEFELLVSGNATNSKTTINLVSGALTNDIQNKLSDESYYEVNTPNSTMSVRGTVPRIEIYEVDGVFYTNYMVFEGEVEIQLIGPDGDKIGKSVNLKQDMQVTVYTNETETDFVTAPIQIDADNLPEKVYGELQKIFNLTLEPQDQKRDQLGKWLETTGDETKVTVTYKYNGTVFATQIIDKGDKATNPLLQPAETGKWDYDFSVPVTDDIVIIWNK